MLDPLLFEDEITLALLPQLSKYFPTFAFLPSPEMA
jgi:hypothetical protein